MLNISRVDFEIAAVATFITFLKKSYWHVIVSRPWELPLPLWEAISAQFQGDWALPAALQRRHLWLAQRPVSQLHQGVWDLVCLAAVCAMDHARRQWCARKERGSLPGASMVDRIGRHAVANFWLNLGDICGLNMLPRRWREAVPAGHPFLFYDSETERWHVRQ